MHTNTGVHKQHTPQRGFALLVAVLISSVVLAVGLSMLNITLKQYIFSGTGRESEIAFYAADAGMECALYFDTSTAGGVFDLSATGGSFSCMDQSTTAPAGGTSGVAKTFVFEWNTSGQTVCTKIAITKYYSATNPVSMGAAGTCDARATCTQVESRGYNRGCNGLSSARVVERALRASY
ncbi:MAG: hypothetical protein RLZZ234_407 [Candidatus Parcubacteria bacterium]